MYRQELYNNGLKIVDLGIADYKSALSEQLELVEKRRNGEVGDTVFVLEHEDVITLGARKEKNLLLSNSELLQDKGIDIVEVRRGGGATAHNIGQLVFYPILDLKQMDLGITDYVRQLEAIGIELLQGLGVSADRLKGFPGLWVEKKKIASIGVRVSKFVTYHGMAINIQNDLSIFDHMVPCGLKNVEMTSVLKETGKKFKMSEIKKQLTGILVSHFANERNR